MAAENPVRATLQLIFTLLLMAYFPHFTWEMWQVPYYTGMADLAHWDALQLCTRAAVGDAIIALLAYFAAARVSPNGRWWLFQPVKRAWILYLVSGIAMTVIMELLATQVFGRWQYSELMPEIPLIRVGLLPVLQWLVIPPLTLWMSATFIRGLQSHDQSADHINPPGSTQ